MAKTQNKSQRQKQALTRLIIMAAILLCVNVLASYLHTGIDLTRENRFTLTEPTRKMLRNMKETAVIDVYLKGKFPAGLQRLQEAIRERLNTFRDISGNKIIVRFIDPLEGKNASEQKQVVHDLDEKGIHFLELNTKDEDAEYSMKPFFPYALLQYNNRQMPIMLLENPPGKSAEEKISYADAMLEYKFANAINTLGRPDHIRIAYITGNDEPLGIETIDLHTAIRNFYDLDTVDLSHSIEISPAYDAIVIYAPKTPFSGPEKLKIDQYVMRGGHVLWAVSTMNASLDSLAAHPPQMISMEYGLDLDDILFKYGVRINNNLIEDEELNLPLPLTVNGRTEPDLHAWPYFPKLNPTSDNPIVKNMDFVIGGFTSSIDTLKSALIKKTVLLHTSGHSLDPRSPVRVSLGMMTYPMKPEMFNKSYLPVGVLLEGKFHSAYERLLAPSYLRVLDSIHHPFKSVCDTTNSMIVVSVGNIFTNSYSAKDGVLPMGYYNYTGEFYANRDFMLNCLQYLTDPSGVLEARSKEVKMRLLDDVRAKNEKTTWQVVNVSIPIAIVLIFASAYFFFRKRRYETKTNAPNSAP
jgi:ABC-2 type transport system permease protein